MGTGAYKLGSLGDIIAQSCGLSQPDFQNNFDPKLTSLFNNNNSKNKSKKALKRLGQGVVKPSTKDTLALPAPPQPKVKPPKLLRNQEAADIRLGAKAKFGQGRPQPDPILPPRMTANVKRPTEVPNTGKKSKGKLPQAGKHRKVSEIDIELGEFEGSKRVKVKKPKGIKQKREFVESGGGKEIKEEVFVAGGNSEAKAVSNQSKAKKRKRDTPESDSEVIKKEAEAAAEDSEAKVVRKKSKVKKEGNAAPKSVEEQNTPKDKDPELEARTVFVGNVPKDLSKKALLTLFRPFGSIETLRLRCGAPDKPNRLKKVAINKKELHPDRNSVAAYVRFSSREEAEKAAGAGLEVNGHHLSLDLADNSKKRDPKRAIFVGNLPLKCVDDDLWTFFEDCGKVESVRVIRDRATGLGKGFGYVNFMESTAVEVALQKDGTELNNRALRISRSIKKPKNPFNNGQPSENRNNKFGKGKKGRSQGQKQRGEVMEFGGDTTAEIGKFKRNSKKPNIQDVKKARVAKQLARPVHRPQPVALGNQKAQNYAENGKSSPASTPKKIKKPRHVPRVPKPQ